MKVMPLMFVMLLSVSGSYQYRPSDSNTGSFLKPSIAEFQNARLFDQFGAVTSNDEKARLDNYAYELHNDPSSMGYVIVYGRTSRPGEAKKRADRIKQYLSYYRGIEMGRLVSLDHCFLPRLEVRLWIVPRGAKPPVPCATKTPAKARTTTVRPR